MKLEKGSRLESMPSRAWLTRRLYVTLSASGCRCRTCSSTFTKRSNAGYAASSESGGTAVPAKAREGIRSDRSARTDARLGRVSVLGNRELPGELGAWLTPRPCPDVACGSGRDALRERRGG